jgi:hypothetical protein
VEEVGALEDVGAVEELDVEEEDVPLTAHPTRVELMATSSYQKVFGSLLYDSQPK